MDNKPRRRPRVCDDDRAIAARLRRLRLERGVSQETVAFILGVSYQQVQKYESGTNRISLTRLRLLKDFYGVPWETFLGGAGDGVEDGQARASAFAIDDPETMRLCRKLAQIGDTDLRRKAGRMIDILIRYG